MPLGIDAVTVGGVTGAGGATGVAAALLDPPPPPPPQAVTVRATEIVKIRVKNFMLDISLARITWHLFIEFWCVS